MIWLDHPTLNIYALRLTAWKDVPVAIANNNGTQLSYVVPATMNWLPEKENRMIDTRYSYVAIIHNKNGLGEVKVASFSQSELRDVNTLISKVQMGTI